RWLRRRGRRLAGVAAIFGNNSPDGGENFLHRRFGGRCLWIGHESNPVVLSSYSRVRRNASTIARHPLTRTDGRAVESTGLLRAGAEGLSARLRVVDVGTEPAPAGVVVMGHGVVDLDRQVEVACQQGANRRRELVGKDDFIALRADQAHPGREEILLGV